MLTAINIKSISIYMYIYIYYLFIHIYIYAHIFISCFISFSQQQCVELFTSTCRWCHVIGIAPKLGISMSGSPERFWKFSGVVRCFWDKIVWNPLMMACGLLVHKHAIVSFYTSRMASNRCYWRLLARSFCSSDVSHMYKMYDI